MQLDQTEIAVRERGMLELLDLALHVFRAHLAPVLILQAIVTVPLMIINELAIGGPAASTEILYYPEAIGRMEFGGPTSDGESGFLEMLEFFGDCSYYVWMMTCLIAIESQLASCFVTDYLGKAVFLKQPSLGEVLRDVGTSWHRLLWTQLFSRGVLLAIVVAFMSHWTTTTSGVLMFFVAALFGIIRSLRPHLLEIVLLEKLPLWKGKHESAMTVSTRSGLLHQAGADMASRSWAWAAISVMLVSSVFGTILFASGVFLGDWLIGPLLLRFFLPLSMWLVACFLGVARFLAYIDLRIRQEGWEVDLRLRAEAARLKVQTAA